MDRDKVYEKRARLYPVITAMLIPLFLLIQLSSQSLSTFSNLEHIWNIIISIIPATLITGALTYGLKNLARSTSKAIFQYSLFKEDETRMPTTDLLLWKNNKISKQNKIIIREKINLFFGLELLNEDQELDNESEARLVIVDAVKRIREKTRDNRILFDYNCNFGFIRNYLGASFLSLIVIVCLGLINLFIPLISFWQFIAAIIIILISFPISIFVLKQNGKEYANQLFNAFLELK
jgi:hypothetical protein